MKATVQSSDGITDMLVGLSDGLTVPFAITAGLSAAAPSSDIVFTTGLIVVAAGGIILGIGGYFTGLGSLKEQTEAGSPDQEKMKLRQSLIQLEIDENIQAQAMQDVEAGESEWQEMLEEYYPDHHADRQSPLKSGLNIAGSYIFGGMISVLPYLLFSETRTALLLSFACSLAALFVFGYFRAKVTSTNILSSAFRAVLTGTVAALLSWTLVWFIMR